MINKIVWASYGSLESSEVLNFVTFLARKFGAEIICLYIKPTSYYEGLEYLPADQTSLFTEWVNQVSNEKIQDIYNISNSLKEDGLKSRLEVKKGIPHEEIIRFSKEEKADLIAMGNEKNVDIQPSISRTTLKLIRQSEIPVLTINQEQSDIDIKNILVPTDLYNIHSEDFNYSVNLSNNFDNSKVFHLNVLGTAGTNLPAEVVVKLRGDTYDKIAKEDINYKNVEAKVVEAINPWIGIAEFAEKHYIDLIVMTSYSGKKGRRKDFIGSVAERVIQTVKCPVIIVKP